MQENSGFFFYNVNIKLNNFIYFTYQDHPGTSFSGSVTRPDDASNSLPANVPGNFTTNVQTASQTHRGVTFNYEYWQTTTNNGKGSESTDIG